MRKRDEGAKRSSGGHPIVVYDVVNVLLALSILFSVPFTLSPYPSFFLALSFDLFYLLYFLFFF